MTKKWFREYAFEKKRDENNRFVMYSKKIIKKWICGQIRPYFYHDINLLIFKFSTYFLLIFNEKTEIFIG